MHWVNDSMISANMADSGEEIHWLMLEEEWTLESLEIAKWLQTLQKPDRMSRAQYQQFQHKAMGFLVQDGYLFKQMAWNEPIHQVVDDERIWIQIL